MGSEHYAAFVDEAFVKPIRSVLIVDDDYPTFEELLDAELARSAGREPDMGKDWHRDPENIKRVIANFRTPARPLLVDIHDGSNVKAGAEIRIASHLHQSDLLVLDYQLDKMKKGDGSLAIEIIRSLVRNDHFNLVVVHTSEDLDVVFQDTLLALMRPQGGWIDGAAAAAAEEALLEAEDQVEGAGAELDAAVATSQYLRARARPKSFVRDMMDGRQPFSAFAEVCGRLKWRGDRQKSVLLYLLDRVERRLADRMNHDASAAMEWDAGKVKFVKTESVFIAFSAKSGDDDLMEDLRDALSAWGPPPSHLFLAKLRAEMDDHGAVAQGSALESRHALAHWYWRLLEADGVKRRWLVAESVARHSEGLMAGILPRVEEFAGRLADTEAASGSPHELSRHHFKIDLTKESERIRSEREHNAYVSTKPPEGWHLNTGHVFTIGGDYWICVSPACDMVPSQLAAARIAALGERLPFVAVKLQPISASKPIEDVSSNRYLFIKIDGVVRAFCFNDPARDSSAPAWDILFARNRGQFNADFTFRVFVNVNDKGRLQTRQREAHVIAQLRYEYALNLMQRLGASQTRIGLDYV